MSKKNIEEELFLLNLLRRDGWWACKDCTTENWTMYHKKEELNCPKTGKPREECEVENI
jgi:hypothetical protein